jgi:hypothetical protein
VASVPAVLALKGRYEARGLRVVSVTDVDADEMASEKPLIQKAAEEEKMTYPCYVDVGAAWQKSVGIEGVPSFLVVGADGKIIHKMKGKLTEDSEHYQKIVSAIDGALAAK